MFAERIFKKRDLIGMHVGWKCDKNSANTYNKSIKCSSNNVVIFPGKDIKSRLGLGVIYINDKTCNCDQAQKPSINNSHFCKVKETTKEEDDEDSDDITESLAHASVNSYEDTELSTHHQHI